MNPKNFFAELKRRNVYKVAVAYAVVSWLLIQAASIVLPTFEAPAWTMKVLLVALIVVFPIAVVLAWAFEITPEGIVRAEDVVPNKSITYKTGRKLIGLTVALAVIAAGLFVFQMVGTDRRAIRSNPLDKENGRRSAASLPVADKSIAVLPFENLSDDKTNSYFADGIQDEVLTRLSKIAELKVISRTSTQKYKSAPDNLREIAQQLGVASILEGSVQKAGDQVRITVQLINALTDAHLWAETYDRKLSDVFQVETEVAQRIAASLEAKLTGRERHDIARVPTANAEAYDAYLHGLAFDEAQTTAGLDKALEFHRKAVALDPTFAVAWAKLGYKESEKYFTETHTAEQLARAKHAAETALRLQPDLGEAHQAAGLFAYYCFRDYEHALAELSQASERLPNDATIILSIGLVKRRQGKLDESIEFLRQATNLDPRNLDVWLNLGRSYRGARRFDEAHAAFDRCLAVSPGEPISIASKAETYLAQGDLEMAEKLTSGLENLPLEDPFGRSIANLSFRRQFDRAISILAADVQRKETASPSLAAVGRAAIAVLKFRSGSPDARPSLESARSELKAVQAQGGGSLRINEMLLEVEASLGNRDAVAREADGLLRDTSKDLWQAPFSEESVARAYAILGDAERAIPLLEHALSVPGLDALTPTFLRLDPVWDRIRNAPRFQKLCEVKP